jgi:membrane-associated protein
MDQIGTIVHQASHLDTYINVFIDNHGLLVYVILGTIIFLETGLFVLAPILPSDTLIFTAGAVAASGNLHIMILIALFIVAAIGGDSLNYLLGRLLKKPLFSGRLPFLNQKRLNEVQKFFKNHGGMTVLYGRFIPVIRTFVPFTAGSGTMEYPKFLLFCIIGVTCWVLLNSLTGYFFGQIPFVKKYPALILLGLALFALIPGAIQFFYYQKKISKN